MGGPRGPNSQQAHDVVTTSMRRNDVASTSFRRRVPIRFLINQCQIITFLILIYDNIENSRIELRGIVLPVQMGGLLGGAKGYVGPPLSNYWGGGLAPPGPPSSYAYVVDTVFFRTMTVQHGPSCCKFHKEINVNRRSPQIVKKGDEKVKLPCNSLH